MKIGVMGLGTIAQKAYLPIMGSMQSIDWVVHTRNETVLKNIQEEYNFDEGFSDFDAFINSGIEACFIHTPTHTHYQFIKLMLEHGIHVYVDKPISESIDETEELLVLAKKQGRILMTGFNRRFAPLTQRLKNIENKNMIVIRKNRPEANQETQFALYDMMIHVVDTALFLNDEPILSSHVSISETNGILNRAILNMETKNCSTIAYMNMDSGARPETFEVMSREGHYIVDDLNTLTIKREASDEIINFPDWTPVLERRGFKASIEHFIAAIKGNKPYDTTLDLKSHQAIKKILDSK